MAQLRDKETSDVADAPASAGAPTPAPTPNAIEGNPPVAPSKSPSSATAPATASAASVSLVNNTTRPYWLNLRRPLGQNESFKGEISFVVLEPGVPTRVSAEDYAFLKKNPVFVGMMDSGAVREGTLAIVPSMKSATRLRKPTEFGIPMPMVGNQEHVGRAVATVSRFETTTSTAAE